MCGGRLTATRLPAILSSCDCNHSATQLTPSKAYRESTMSNSQRLIAQLSAKFEIPDETQQELKSQCFQSSKASQTTESSAVEVGFTKTVSTFIAQKSYGNFAVPHFASHWGVVCDFTSRDRYLYHLVFNIETRTVEFQPFAWRSEWTDKHNVVPVGTTLYDIHTVSEIGDCIYLYE